MELTCPFFLFSIEVKHALNLLPRDMRFYTEICINTSVTPRYRSMLIQVASSVTLCLDGREQWLKEALRAKGRRATGMGFRQDRLWLIPAAPRSETTQAPFFLC